MERITIKAIEEQFEKWNKNDVVRIRKFFKNTGKTYAFKNEYIIFTHSDDLVCFYLLQTGDYFSIPKQALNFALNFIND